MLIDTFRKLDTASIDMASKYLEKKKWIKGGVNDSLHLKKKFSFSDFESKKKHQMVSGHKICSANICSLMPYNQN